MFHAGLPSDDELDRTELRFLEDFCNLLTTAHYRLLTEDEWRTATDEEFTASYCACSLARLLWLLCYCNYTSKQSQLQH